MTIVGIGEDGMDGLCAASRAALAAAELVVGSPRHLALLPALTCPVIEWPAPFAQGVAALLKHRGQRVVMLASGDPFWFGGGATVTRDLARDEWIAHPAPSTFSLAAARLGWSLQETVCLGLHAAPLDRLRPHLAPGRRALVLVRDGHAVRALAQYLARLGFGPTGLSRMEMQDTLGQRTVISFGPWVRNPRFAPATFRFTPPKGTDVVGTPVTPAQVKPLRD